MCLPIKRHSFEDIYPALRDMVVHLICYSYNNVTQNNIGVFQTCTPILRSHNKDYSLKCRRKLLQRTIKDGFSSMLLFFDNTEPIF